MATGRKSSGAEISMPYSKDICISQLKCLILYSKPITKSTMRAFLQKIFVDNTGMGACSEKEINVLQVQTLNHIP